MSEQLTVRGWVATDPRSKVTRKGIPITSFRVASTERRYNKEKETWENAYTSWFTVVAYRRLATNVTLSIRKGDRAIIHGKFRLKEWQSENSRGVIAEIEASSVGHDLSWGTSYFNKNYGRHVVENNSNSEEAADKTETNHEELQLDTENKETYHSGVLNVETGELIEIETEKVVAETAEATIESEIENNEDLKKV
ncbi:MAG: single-stranded DNA-binding protein [Micrococcaceae bacterium]